MISFRYSSPISNSNTQKFDSFLQTSTKRKEKVCRQATKIGKENIMYWIDRLKIHRLNPSLKPKIPLHESKQSKNHTSPPINNRKITFTYQVEQSQNNIQFEIEGLRVILDDLCNEERELKTQLIENRQYYSQLLNKLKEQYLHLENQSTLLQQEIQELSEEIKNNDL